MEIKILKNLTTETLLKQKFNQIENKFIKLVENKWQNRKATVLPTLNYDSGPLNPMLKVIKIKFHNSTKFYSK